MGWISFFGDRHLFFWCPKIVHLFIWTFLKHPAKKGVVGYSKILLRCSGDEEIPKIAVYPQRWSTVIQPSTGSTVCRMERLNPPINQCEKFECGDLLVNFCLEFYVMYIIVEVVADVFFIYTHYLRKRYNLTSWFFNWVAQPPTIMIACCFST